MLVKALYLNGLLFATQTVFGASLPLRDLQTRAVEPSRGRPETTVCEEGDEECVEEPVPVAQIEEEGLTDASIIAIVIGSVLGLIAILTALVVFLQVMKHKKKVNQKKHLGIQLQRQVTETEKKLERRATLLQKERERANREDSDSESSFVSESLSELSRTKPGKEKAFGESVSESESES